MTGHKSVKVVLVGDGAVGKTCLLLSYAQDKLPDEYVPTVFDSYSVTVPMGEENIELNMFDTAGQEDYDKWEDDNDTPIKELSQVPPCNAILQYFCFVYK